jgi:hypothetical protein
MINHLSLLDAQEAPVDEYDGRQFVGIDLHRRRSVIVRMTPEGERLGAAVRIDNDPFGLAQQVAAWGESPEVVLEATYGWYWAADVLAEAGANVHLAHPLGVKGFAYRRVKNDELDARDLADLLRMGRLPEAWIAPPEIRGLREEVRHRCKLVALRSGLKAQVHAVLAKQGVQVPMSDLFGVGGQTLLDELRLDPRSRQECCRCVGSSTRSRLRSTFWPSASVPGSTATPGSGRFRPCPGWARCWARCSSPRSVT